MHHREQTVAQAERGVGDGLSNERSPARALFVTGLTASAVAARHCTRRDWPRPAQRDGSRRRQVVAIRSGHTEHLRPCGIIRARKGGGRGLPGRPGVDAAVRPVISASCGAVFPLWFFLLTLKAERCITQLLGHPVPTARSPAGDRQPFRLGAAIPYHRRAGRAEKHHREPLIGVLTANVSDTS